MRERPIDFDERALDKLVVIEFNRLEKKPPKCPMHLKEKAPQPVDNIDQTVSSESGEDDEEIISEEEEKFVKETFTWLKPRENKDVIIARIWDLLIESESFYDPPSDDINRESKHINGYEDKAIIEPKPMPGKEKTT